MIELRPTTPEHLLHIRAWIAVDPWHKDDLSWQPEELLTGRGLLAFCLADNDGPLVYIRLDEDKEMVHIAMQFGPESVVSKRRLIVGLVQEGIPAMVKFAKEKGYKGLIFESVNPALIAFGNRQGFNPASGNDYALMFEEKNNV
jgi:hypothetical protein